MDRRRRPGGRTGLLWVVRPGRRVAAAALAAGLVVLATIGAGTMATGSEASAGDPERFNTRLVVPGDRLVKLTGRIKGPTGSMRVDTTEGAAFEIVARTRISTLTLSAADDADGGDCGIGRVSRAVTSRPGTELLVPVDLSPGRCTVVIEGLDRGRVVAHQRLDLTVVGEAEPPIVVIPPTPNPEPEPEPEPEPTPDPEPEPGEPHGDYGRLVWSSDFAPGWERRWPGYQDTTAPQNRRAITDPTGRFDHVLRVSFADGVVGPRGGTQFKSTFSPTATSATLVYNIRFGEGFEYVKGGKLPGFTGGLPDRRRENTGGNTPDGTDGWSVRLGFRDSRTSPGSMALRTYSYLPPGQQDPAQNNEYLFDAWGNKTFWSGKGKWGISNHFLNPDAPEAGQDLIIEPGLWYRVALQVNLNTPGRTDGSIRAWIRRPGDTRDRLAIDVPELTFRDAGHDLPIDRIFFSTFFGGATPEHAPIRDERIDFADFALYTTD